jgi:hypothetical protein
VSLDRLRRLERRIEAVRQARPKPQQRVFRIVVDGDTEAVQAALAQLRAEQGATDDDLIVVPRSCTQSRGLRLAAPDRDASARSKHGHSFKQGGMETAASLRARFSGCPVSQMGSDMGQGIVRSEIINRSMRMGGEPVRRAKIRAIAGHVTGGTMICAARER